MLNHRNLHTDPSQIDKGWYFSIEYEKDKFTPGSNFASTALTRSLLQHTSVEGRSCLDLGTMEGLVPFLMMRRGADYVAGTDGNDFSRQVDFLRRKFDTWFDYFPHISSDRLVDFFQRKYHHERYYETTPRDRNTFGFDVVVCSGILYHTFSPIHFLGQARTLLKKNGILIVETAAMLTPSYYMQFNFTGENYVYAASDTWMISVPLLDYMLRYMRLQPLACRYLKQSDQLARVAVACRASDEFFYKKKEDRFEESLWNLDYESLVDYNLAAATEPVGFQAPPEWSVPNAETGCCDLMSTIISTQPVNPTADEIRLRLSDIY